MLERNGLVKGNNSRIVVTAMDDFETDLRKRRKKKLERRRRRLKSIEADYQKAQDYESGKQT
jgi:hypothetical protein